MRTMIATSIAVALLGVVPASAATTLVTFSTASCVGGCVSGSFIDQGFGNSAGVSLSYRSMSTPGNSATSNSSLYFWSGDYSGSDAAWSDLVGEIKFNSTTAGTFTLNSVDFGGWPNAIIGIQYRVYDLGYTLLSSGTLDTLTSALTTVNFGQSSTSGLIFQFGPDGFNGGIQNVSYSFEAGVVPEPASWAMMIGGFGLVGATMRRRRAAIA